jgi:hypothetical protein
MFMKKQKTQFVCHQITTHHLPGVKSSWEWNADIYRAADENSKFDDDSLMVLLYGICSFNSEKIAIQDARRMLKELDILYKGK